jgi:hypothetical protein
MMRSLKWKTGSLVQSSNTLKILRLWKLRPKLKKPIKKLRSEWLSTRMIRMKAVANIKEINLAITTIRSP